MLFQTHRGLIEICIDDKCIKYGDHAKREEMGLDADEGGTKKLSQLTNSTLKGQI